MQTWYWVIILMVALTVTTFGMFLNDLEPKDRGRAIAAALIAIGILLILGSMVFSNLG